MFAANSDVVTEVDQQAESVSRSKSEKVEVTGSRLKRVEAEGMVPIVLIDRAQLERSGFTTLSDVIREMKWTPLFGPVTSLSYCGIYCQEGSMRLYETQVLLAGI